VQSNKCIFVLSIYVDIIVEKFGAVTTLNIDRQHTRNSLDEPTLRELTAAIEAFDKDQSSHVLVFNGEGGSFCSGFDIDEMEKIGYNNMKDAAVSNLIFYKPSRLVFECISYR
jgi:enoyl-CoA hydratase/carnithine racemase